jgi:hypothetical protein
VREESVVAERIKEERVKEERVVMERVEVERVHNIGTSIVAGCCCGQSYGCCRPY